MLDAESTSSASGRRGSWAIAIACTVGGIVACLASELRDPRFRDYPIYDNAAIEVHVRQAAHGVQLLGPYSRFGWRHPGPLPYYLLLPAYALAGEQTAALHAGAALINLAALALALWVVLGLCRTDGQRWALLSISALMLLCLATDFSGDRSGYIVGAFCSIWNPISALIPFAALILLSVAAARGSRAACCALLLLHALVVQSHVAYFGPASVLALFGAIRCLRTRGARRDRTRTLAAAVAVIAGAWALPVAQQLAADEGNLGALLRFFFVGDGRRGELALSLPPHAAAFLSRPFSGLLEWAGIAGGALRAVAAALCGLQLVGLVVGYAWIRRRSVTAPSPSADQGLVATLSEACLLATTTGLAMALVIPGEPHIHLYYWLSIVGAMNWLAIALLFIAWRETRRRPHAPRAGAGEPARPRPALPRWTRASLWGLLLACSAGQVLLTAQVRQRNRERRRQEQRAVRGAAETLQRLATSRRPLAIAFFGDDALRLGAGVVLELLKRDAPLSIVADAGYFFGAGPRYVPALPPAHAAHVPIWLADRPLPRRRAIYGRNGLFVFRGP